MTAPSPLALRARWVFPVDRPSIERGVVTIAGGRIVAVGQNASGTPTHDLGDVALLPGLVNAHAHLEFSLLRKPLAPPGTPFARWIEHVVNWRRERGVASQEPGVRSGLVESQSAGVAALGEIATSGWPAALFATSPDLAAVVLLELLGLAPERVDPLIGLARQHIAACRQAAIRPGLAPHAPYTVHPELLGRACQLSAQERLPLAMHLAESHEELELLNAQTGPLVDRLQSLGAWHPGVLARGLRPLDYLRQLAAAHRAVVIHGNYLAEDEIELLATYRERLSLIYCPRTHAYFGHEPYPLAHLLAAGVRVAVGTDSRASNPDLSLFEELRHIARHHPGVPAEAILRMGTLAGAQALGVADELGSVTPGKLARLAVVDLADQTCDPLENILKSATAAIRPWKETSWFRGTTSAVPSTEY